MPRPDVIILGAGAAGLNAARVLAGAGCSVLILEARSRVGGRILPVRDPDFGMPVELGAEFIHGRPPATWDLVREAGLTVYDVPFEHRQRRRGRLVKIEDFGGELDKVMGGLSRLRGPDISFAEYLRKHRGVSDGPDARLLATSFVEGFDAADPERVSAQSLAQEQEGLGDVGGEMQFRLLHGYGGVIGYLRGALDPRRVTVRLGAPVREVGWQPTKVEVRCGREGRESVFRAPRLIVTLPLGVLQLPPETPGSVRFTPDIPAHREAAGQLGSGPVVKAVLRFREAFWEEGAVARSARADEGLKDAAFLHDPDAPFPTWWTARPLRNPVLTAWAGGPKALALSGLSRAALTDVALKSLSMLLGVRCARLVGLLEKIHAHDWPADPFSRGAYSYVTVGGGRARHALARPLKGTIFFAGEATDLEGQASTVAGALASGRRAAAQVLARL